MASGYNDKSKRRRTAAGDSRRDQQAQQDANARAQAQRNLDRANRRFNSRAAGDKIDAANAAYTGQAVGGSRSARSADEGMANAMRGATAAANKEMNRQDAKRRKGNAPSDRSAAARKAWATRRARGRGKA